MSDHLTNREVERLLRQAAEVRQFERDLGLADDAPIALRPRRPWRLLAPLAVAALLAFAASVWFLNFSDRASEKETAPGMPGIVSPRPTTADGAAPESPVNMVVALYRGDTRPGERCADCWCVARWDADWGEGRTVAELEHEELVSDSVAHSCVGEPRRVVVIGLSGPASAMPRTDQQAFDLSLCLMGEAPPTQTSGGDASISCIPKGLDYCMADWSR